MAYIILQSRRTRPRGVPRFNADIPRPTFCYLPSVGQIEIARNQAGAKASGDSIRVTRNGIAYKTARATGGGLDFGVQNVLNGDVWTMLAFANPASGDGVSCLFSQRTNTTPFYQADFLANAGTPGALTASPGNLQVVIYNSTGYTGYISGGTAVDGNWHTFAATRGRLGVIATIEIYRDGIAQSVANGGSSISSVGGTQRVRVGNLGDYSTDAAYASQCDFALVAAWDSVLSTEILSQLTPEHIWGVMFAPDPRRLYFGVSGGAGAYELDAQPGGYTVSGTAATLLRGIVLDAQPATYTVSGTAASIVRGYNLNAATGTFTATGAAATLLRGLSVNAAPGSFSVSGVDATLEYTQPGAYTLDAQPGSYSLTGVAATLTYTPLNAYTLDAQPASYVITVAAATLTYAGASIWTDVGVSAATWSDVGAASSIWTDL